MALWHLSGPQFPWPPVVGGGHSSKPVPSPRCLSPCWELQQREALAAWSGGPRSYEGCSALAPSLATASPPLGGWPPPPCTAGFSQTILPSSRPVLLPEPLPRPPPQPRGHPSKWGREGPQPWGLSVLDPVWGSRQVVSPFSASCPPDSKAGLLLWCFEASPLTWGRSSPGREQLQGLPVPGGGGARPTIPPLPVTAVTLSPQPGGAGGPGGTVSPFEARAAVDQLSQTGLSAGSGQGPRLCRLQ